MCPFKKHTGETQNEKERLCEDKAETGAISHKPRKVWSPWKLEETGNSFSVLEPLEGLGLVAIFFFFSQPLRSMWDLSSSTRVQTLTPCIGSTVS